jgi:hypothetical protein
MFIIFGKISYRGRIVIVKEPLITIAKFHSGRLRGFRSVGA